MSRLRHLTDDELLRHAEAAQDPLTTTEYEAELIKRFSNVIDERIANAAFIEVLDDHSIYEADELKKSLTLLAEFDALDIRSLLEAITAAGIETAEGLKARLAIADKFDGIANDAGDLFDRLTSLIATTQE